MKIAISLFGDRVSPRFDLSSELLIVREENGKLLHQEKISVEGFNIMERIEKLTLSGINKVICGGIHDISLSQLQNRGIDVFHNVSGEADVALNFLLKGALQAGSHCKRRKNRNFNGLKKEKMR